MESGYQWISRSDELAEIVGGMGAERLALDTEADSMHHYPEKVCLVQLSHRGCDYLVDPLDGIDLGLLGPVLASSSVTKVLHGADYDLRVLHRDFGLKIRGLFDTMVAAKIIGERALGLAALLKQRFGVTLNKRYQRADWSRRPLPEEMARYAVLDTRHLPELADSLVADLERLGRTAWAQEEFRRLEAVRWTEPDGELTFRRIKGAGKLDRRGLAVLRELVAVREAEARKRDRPPFMILRNDTLIELARRRPVERAEILRLPGLPRPWRGGRSAALLEAVRRGMSLDEEDLPGDRPRSRPRRSAEFEARVRRLARERDAVAADLGLEPAVLSPRAVLEAAVGRSERGEDPRETPGLRSWQASLLEEALARLGG
jgi:ribonuclease D